MIRATGVGSWIVGLLLLAPGLLCHADPPAVGVGPRVIIKLKSGGEIWGILIRETAAEVHVKTKVGEMGVSRADIVTIKLMAAEPEAEKEKRRPPLELPAEPVSADGLKLLVPAKTSADDAIRAAVAMMNRCDLYGYSGVVARAEKRPDGRFQVRMTCGSGMTADMERTIRLMGGTPASSCEVLIRYEMNDVEREQFSPPKPDCDLKSLVTPRGTMWQRSEVEDREPVMLTFAEPLCGREGLVVRPAEEQDKQDDSSRFHLFLSSAAADRFRAKYCDVYRSVDTSPRLQTKPHCGGLYLRVDGCIRAWLQFQITGAGGEMPGVNIESTQRYRSRILGLLKYPMPVPLE